MPDKKDEVNKIEKESKNGDLVINLYQLGQTIANLRNKPLLLMFYSRERGAGIEEEDVFYLEEKLEETLKDNTKELDVLIQTTGGDADTSYLLAQLIRDYCYKMEIFVPYYAYSGGTLISLSSDLIHLGKTARLSPIDLQLNSEEISQFSLLNIDKYLEFIADSCKKFNFKDEQNKTHYIIPLVERLIQSIGVMDLGMLFRVRTLTEYHAGILLKSYMFRNDPNKTMIAQHIIEKLTSGSPDHDFEIDFHIAKGIKLKVQEMETKIYKLSRQLIDICSLLKRHGKICNFYSELGERRRPFFEVFLPQNQTKQGGKKDESTSNNE